LEAIAFRVLEVVRVMEQDSGQKITQIRADCGVARNDFLLQFQADLLGVPIRRVRGQEMTALGVAYLAGLQSGFWSDDAPFISAGETFQPVAGNDAPQRAFVRWQDAVRLAKSFGDGR
jgi:glycerol kinase